MPSTGLVVTALPIGKGFWFSCRITEDANVTKLGHFRLVTTGGILSVSADGSVSEYEQHTSDHLIT